MSPKATKNERTANNSQKQNLANKYEDYLDAVGEKSEDLTSIKPNYAPKFNSEKINIEAVLDMIMSQLEKVKSPVPNLTKSVDSKAAYENLWNNWTNSFTSLRDRVFEGAREETKQTILKLEKWIDENTWALVDEHLGGKNEQVNAYRTRWPYIDLTIYKEKGLQKTYLNGTFGIGELDLDFGKPGGAVAKINGPKGDVALGTSEEVLGARASISAAELFFGFRSIDERGNQGDKLYSDILIGVNFGNSKGALARDITDLLSVDLSNPSSVTISFGKITIRRDSGVWQDE